jgi:hypothetical protein
VLNVRYKTIATLIAPVLVLIGLGVLYAANAHPPLFQTGCGISIPDELPTVFLNQDGTVNYMYKCRPAKYAGETFIVLNVVGLTTVGVVLKELYSMVRE